MKEHDMRLRRLLRRAGVAAATVGLGAGLAVQGVGCAEGGAAGSVPGPTSNTSVLPSLPILDLEAPARFETAAFAFG
jgi:hypothetical protein